MTIFFVAPTAFYTHAPPFQESINSSGGYAFCCCDGHTCTAFCTSSSDLIWRPSTASFKAQKKWNSPNAKSGEYGGRRNAAKFKSRICCTVWRAVWSLLLWRCTHTPEDRKPRRFLRIASIRWFPNISLYYVETKFAGCCSILQTGHITLSSTPDQQLENHSTKYHRQQPPFNTLELLMMGIVMPETCWASNKICNKKLCCIELAFYFHIYSCEYVFNFGLLMYCKHNGMSRTDINMDVLVWGQNCRLGLRITREGGN